MGAAGSEALSISNDAITVGKFAFGKQVSSEVGKVAVQCGCCEKESELRTRQCGISV